MQQPASYITYKDGFNSSEYLTTEISDIIQKLRDRRFLLRDTGLTSRLYNQWKTNGLIETPVQTDSRSWVTLSMTDMIWLKMLDDLRKFGCSLETIKKVKALCYGDAFNKVMESFPEAEFGKIVVESLKKTPLDKKVIEQVTQQLKKKDFSYYQFIKEIGLVMPLLEAVLANVIVSRADAYIVIFLSDYLQSDNASTANTKVLVKERHKRKPTTEVFFYTEEFQKMTFPVDPKVLLEIPHIKLPLKNYLRDFILDVKNQRIVENLPLLSKEETVLLNEMRKGNVSKITVHYSKNKIDRIDVTRPVQRMEETRLVETFMKNEFANIEYTVEKGQIVKFQKTTKIKPN